MSGKKLSKKKQFECLAQVFRGMGCEGDAIESSEKLRT
jgi:hypothetical protein